MGQSARIYRPGFRDKYDHVISWNKDLLSQVSWLWKKTSDFPLFNSCLYITIRYLENATLKLVKKWTVVIVAFGSHRLTQEPRWNLRGDSEFLDIVNNCRQELRLKNWQHIRIRPWQGIKYSFRSKAKVYHTLRNLIEGEGQRKYLLPQICQGPPRGVDLGRWLYVLHAFCKKRNRAQPLNACIW